MGMTYEQFWEQDCSLVIAYRKAHELRVEHQNFLAWLQGSYVYEAICDASPILHAFAKSGTKAAPYAKEPYPIGRRAEEIAREQKSRREKEAVTQHMEKFMAAFKAKQNQS